MIPHLPLILSMGVLALVIGYAVWLLVIARGAIDPYERMSDDWSPHVEPSAWPKRRAG
jgi:hypothetical protein